MMRGSFSFLTVLALIFAGLVIIQTLLQQNWESAIANQKVFESRLAEAQHRGQVANELIRRLAVEAVKNPELQNVLKNNGIIVKVAPKQAPAANPQDFP